MASQQAKKRLRALQARSDEPASLSGSDTFYISHNDAAVGAPASLIPAAGASQNLHDDAVSSDQRRILRDSIPVQIASEGQAPTLEAQDLSHTDTLDDNGDLNAPFFFDSIVDSNGNDPDVIPPLDEHGRRYTNSVSMIPHTDVSTVN